MIKRYDMHDRGFDNWEMRERPDGEFVRYEDHKTAVASGWRDISSAPKDHTPIWLGHVSGIMVPAFFKRVGSGFWSELYTDRPISWTPSHWMPLPKPPQSNDEGRAA
jgi:hypothetical protein